MWKNIPIIVLVVIIIYLLIPESTISHPPGKVAPSPPSQKNLTNQKTFIHKEYFVTPLAQFSLQARVLSKKWYRWRSDSKIVPLDLALGWGRMSDSAVLDRIKINQSGRKYYWKSKQLPIPKKEISTSSANMHIIPANDQVKQILKKIKKGHVLSLSGYLVKIRDKNGRRWASSLTRTDVGNGACELVWIEKIKLH
ncbi:hypothetical protein H8E88_27385 [candidate division KSB1 bacterium]|nr:hypothetical protein [candidate division KSB1 bacterium]